MWIPRSMFYAAQETTPKQLREEVLVKQIAEIQKEYFFTIGRRRMGTLLKRRFGISVCETTIQRVMSRHCLTARIRQTRKAKPHAGKATKQSLPENLLDREFRAGKPLHRMVTVLGELLNTFPINIDFSHCGLHDNFSWSHCYRFFRRVILAMGSSRTNSKFQKKGLAERLSSGYVCLGGFVRAK